MGKIKMTLPLILSAFLCSLFMLIMSLFSIGFRNSNAGQSEIPNASPNFNENVEETSEGPGQTRENGDPAADSDGGISDSESITSCSVATEILPSPRSTKQWIHPHGNGTKVEVLCDFQVDEGGWTVIQKRSSGPPQEFYRNWSEYAGGFGSLDGNFWLGLENIHTLTKNGDQELRIELEDFEGNQKYAKYSNFSVSDASDFYRLSISGFSGDVPDSMTGEEPNNEAKFSTWDQDNDHHTSHCAQAYAGSWWFPVNCGYSSLNGPYRGKVEAVGYGQGVIWWMWKGNFYSLAKTEMKIRTRKSASESE